MASVSDPWTHLSLQEREALERQLLAQPAAAADASPDRHDAGPQPLTLAQESLWYFDQLLPDSPLYNLPEAFHLKGSLNETALADALHRVIQRHDALRTSFRVVDGTPLQQAQDWSLKVQRINLRYHSADDQAKQLPRVVADEVQRPFRLSEELPVRACLVRIGADEHVLVITLHHIIADFSSVAVLHHDLEVFYNAAIRGESATLSPPPLTFPQWAGRERERNESPETASRARLWAEKLAGAPRALELPSDRPRPESPTYKGGHCTMRLSPDVARRLGQLAAEHHVTMHVVLLAVFQVFLYRYSGQSDLTIGSPVAVRDDADTEQMIGLLVNTAVTRTDLSGNPTFVALLQRTRTASVDALRYQDVPFEKLIEALHLPRRAGVNPLCQVLFQYLTSPWPTLNLDELRATLLEVETGTAKFDLTLTVLPQGETLWADLEFSTELFNSRTAERMLAHWGVLLANAVAHPDTPIEQLPLLTSAERHQVFVAWNRTTTDYPRQSTVHQLFQEQVRRGPQTIALTTGSEQFTYADLNARANQLARYLESGGLRSQEIVAVCLPRGPESIVGLLGVLKAGGAYLPLDPTSPEERLRTIAHDAGARWVLTSSRAPFALSDGLQPVNLTENQSAIAQFEAGDLPERSAASNLAYVIYTSGSTGESKGVAVPHRAVVRLVKETNYARFGPDEVFLQFAPLAFDASTFEIWGALLNGARLVLFPPQFESVEQLIAVIERERVTILWLTAGLFHQVVDDHLQGLKGVRQLLAGGDVLSVPHVLKVLNELPHCQLINGYGPTENTTFTCCYAFAADWQGTSAPIGTPIGNTQVYILNEQLQPVPTGVSGELCVAGDGLALGYLNSPELTAAKFIPNPFSSEPNAKLYRTGDRARYGEDGLIEFIGRADDQVKVNGFRIHLSEVESGLLRLPGVRQAAVLAPAESFGARQLAAFLVVDSDPGEVAWRKAAAERFPSFMVPSRITVLPELPLTPNGKLNRRALAQLTALPVKTQPQSSTVDAAPRAAPSPGVIAAQVIRVWQEVLGREDIGLDDNFFDLGGHSLIATRVISRLNSAFNARLSLATLFTAPTVRALADRLASAAGRGGLGPIRPRARE